MAQEEKTGQRNLAYSIWHRRRSTARFVGDELARELAMIDVDASLYVEYHDGTKDPIALIETALDVGKDYKCATVTKNLARRCQPPLWAYVLLYTLSGTMNPADDRYPDIASFRVKRIWPETWQDPGWRRVTPEEWAKNLLKLRRWYERQLCDPILSGNI
jgi:hypothetical protein